MALTELNPNMGSDNRIYIGATATTTADAQFKRVNNEAKFDFKITNKTTEVEMKENGGQIVTLPGPMQYELTVEATEVYDDDGLPILLSIKNKAWPFQMRNVSASVDGGDTGSTVEMEGSFIVKDVTKSYEASGAVKYQLSLAGAGDVVVASRALTPTVG